MKHLKLKPAGEETGAGHTLLPGPRRAGQECLRATGGRLPSSVPGRGGAPGTPALLSWRGLQSAFSPIAPRAASCKVIVLYLLKLLFKEEFLTVTQPRRAELFWLCLFSFS